MREMTDFMRGFLESLQSTKGCINQYQGFQDYWDKETNTMGQLDKPEDIYEYLTIITTYYFDDVWTNYLYKKIAEYFKLNQVMTLDNLNDIIFKILLDFPVDGVERN